MAEPFKVGDKVVRIEEGTCRYPEVQVVESWSGGPATMVSMKGPHTSTEESICICESLTPSGLPRSSGSQVC